MSAAPTQTGRCSRARPPQQRAAGEAWRPDCTSSVPAAARVSPRAVDLDLLHCARFPAQLQEGHMLKEFRDFVARGNVLDLAVGVIMGPAFGRIVTTLVEGVIMPPIGLLLGRTDFSGLFLILDSSQGIPMSLADAKTKGIPVIAYGQFINDIVTFLIVALTVH